MKKILAKHPETILIASALFFIAVIVGFYFWAVSDIVTTMDKALTYIPPQTNVGFDLQDAAKLDLRGLVK